VVPVAALVVGLLIRRRDPLAVESRRALDVRVVLRLVELELGQLPALRRDGGGRQGDRLAVGGGAGRAGAQDGIRVVGEGGRCGLLGGAAGVGQCRIPLAGVRGGPDGQPERLLLRSDQRGATTDVGVRVLA